jgi:hypothetical protein
MFGRSAVYLGCAEVQPGFFNGLFSSAKKKSGAGTARCGCGVAMMAVVFELLCLGCCVWVVVFELLCLFNSASHIL